MPDGSYRHPEAGPDSFSAHDYFIANPSLSGAGSCERDQMRATVAPVPDSRQIANSHPPQPAPMAIIDIGSNSIRLVIYASQGRYPFPLYNERANCRLGEGMGV